MFSLKCSVFILSFITLSCSSEKKESSEVFSKEASIYTKKHNDIVSKKYNFKDTKDFDNASKGFIAPLDNEGIVKNKDGQVVWNYNRYKKAFESIDKAPDTVNPSLWRQTKLLLKAGLFEVVPGVYQVRGYDISNMTIVEGDKGISIYDPLISIETAKAALDLYYKHRDPNRKRKIKAVFYTHSHIDHFAGVQGIVSQKQVDNGEVKIIGPMGFDSHAIEENVNAGVAMGRRASYMYGNLLKVAADGQVGAGLGLTTSSGITSTIFPSHHVKKTGEIMKVDGLEYQFIMAPNSEAPAEIMWYMPKFKMINLAEDAVYTMHNLYKNYG